jgi:hypothetical protein
MWAKPKDDKVIIEALKAQNRGELTKASNLFRDAGNQYRNPAEKKELWNAAERMQRIRDSD